MGGRAWTASERKRVLLWWCEVDIGYIAKQLHRSPKAVEHVARQMGLRTTRYTETLQRFSDRTGYTDKQVLKAVRALGMNLRRQARVSVPAKGLAQKRHTKGGSAAARAITEEQGERIVQWLREQTAHCWRLQSGGKVRDGVWGVGRKPKACIVCDTTDHPHEAKGKCQRCYDRDRQSTPEAKARANARQRERRKWRKAGNPGVPPRLAPAPRPALHSVAPALPPGESARLGKPHPLSRIGRPRFAPLAMANG